MNIVKRYYFRNYTRALRKRALEKYGLKCARYGFLDVRALQIDHVNGGGKKELGIGRHTYYRKVIDGTSGKYQLLCANCNWIKKYENKNENGGKPLKLV